MRYRVRAHNTATASANKIHDDDVARRLGFRGGLVPGVDVYAYLCHLPAERWGRAWLENGTITVRFEAPVYDGDEVEIVAVEAGGGGGEGQLELTLSDSTGGRCAIARAALPDGALARPDASAWPSSPPPPEPPKATAATLTERPFGSIDATFVADRAAEYLDDVREQLPLFRQNPVAHPGWMLRFANYVLTANVRLGPWIHVESKVELLGVVAGGDCVETRASVTGTRERGGHRFVDLDVVQVVSGEPVSRTAHTAIYQPRGT